MVCPFGTDDDGDALQRAAQASLRGRTRRPLATAPFATDGARAPDLRRRDEHASLLDSDSLTQLLAGQAAAHAAKTRVCEAAAAIFPAGPPPRTREAARRALPPPPFEDEARGDAYYASNAVYARMKTDAAKSSVSSVLRPAKRMQEAFPRSLSLSQGTAIDRFKHSRDRVFKVHSLFADAGALKPGNVPFSREDHDSAVQHAHASAASVKNRSIDSTTIHQSIFGY
ncbi:hypothetical protein M885DRAFT_515199 [Pelagophyceae sp. CCMP2097]|nr:hypothetical protein M885DRAFT_515199 [Pelagophyceae sp. CCMP2097]